MKDAPLPTASQTPAPTLTAPTGIAAPPRTIPSCLKGCWTKSCLTWWPNSAAKLGFALACASVNARDPMALTASACEIDMGSLLADLAPQGGPRFGRAEIEPGE